MSAELEDLKKQALSAKEAFGFMRMAATVTVDADTLIRLVDAVSLKPTGQVTEDERLLLRVFTEPDDIAYLEAVVRLAAKARSYEAICKALSDSYGADGDPLARVQALIKSEEHANSEVRIEQEERHRAQNERDEARSALAASVESCNVAVERCKVGITRAIRAETERDAAVVDNAALLGLLITAEQTWSASHDLNSASHHASMMALRMVLMTQPHPGTALLEEHRKALVRAKNEGLEKAAAEAMSRADPGCEGAEELAKLADDLRAMKEPEQ